MSCLNNDLTVLSLKDLGQSETYKLLLGEIRNVSRDIYEEINGKLQKPTSFTIANAIADIYACSDLTTKIVTADPVVIDNSLTDKIQLRYALDSTVAPLNVEGKYLLVITYDKANLLTSAEKLQYRLIFEVLGFNCPDC